MRGRYLVPVEDTSLIRMRVLLDELTAAAKHYHSDPAPIHKDDTRYLVWYLGYFRSRLDKMEGR